MFAFKIVWIWINPIVLFFLLFWCTHKLVIFLVFIIDSACAASIFLSTLIGFFFISSIVGELGFKELSGYAATKSAINGFTKSLSDELPRKKIRVNSIAPGFIKSSYYNNFKKNKKTLYKWTLSRIPIAKWGENADVADLTIFLLFKIIFFEKFV